MLQITTVKKMTIAMKIIMTVKKKIIATTMPPRLGDLSRIQNLNSVINRVSLNGHKSLAADVSTLVPVQAMNMQVHGWLLQCLALLPDMNIERICEHFNLSTFKTLNACGH